MQCPPAPKHSRRWFQFGMGTLFLVTTVFALWLGWNFKLVRARQEFLLWRDTQCEAESRENPGLVAPLAIWVRPESAKIPMWRNWLGDQATEFLILPRGATVEDHDKAKSLFTEALVYAADGTLLTDVPNR
jgi:hypothetical protein